MMVKLITGLSVLFTNSKWLVQKSSHDEVNAAMPMTLMPTKNGVDLATRERLVLNDRLSTHCRHLDQQYSAAMGS
jgi:hypothetical protein